MIVAVAVNPKGRDMAWQFFKDNNQKLLEQYQVIYSAYVLLYKMFTKYSSLRKYNWYIRNSNNII